MSTNLELFADYLQEKYPSPDGIDVLSEWLIFSRQHLTEDETAELYNQLFVTKAV